VSRRAGRESDPLLRSLLWRLIGRPLFRFSFHNWYRTRHLLLRLHGARLGPKARFRRTVRIDRPWNLAVGELAAVGDGAALRACRPLTIGDRAVVSQMAVVTTECRDAGRPGFPRRAEPIVIENDCWIAADALVLPGSIIRAGAVVGARCLAEGELPAWQVAVGDPAVPRRRRQWRVGDRDAPVGLDAGSPTGPSSVD